MIGIHLFKPGVYSGNPINRTPELQTSTVQWTLIMGLLSVTVHKDPISTPLLLTAMLYLIPIYATSVIFLL